MNFADHGSAEQFVDEWGGGWEREAQETGDLARCGDVLQEYFVAAAGGVRHFVEAQVIRRDAGEADFAGANVGAAFAPFG
jgi:hypothetical protein